MAKEEVSASLKLMQGVKGQCCRNSLPDWQGWPEGSVCGSESHLSPLQVARSPGIHSQMGKWPVLGLSWKMAGLGWFRHPSPSASDWLAVSKSPLML